MTEPSTPACLCNRFGLFWSSASQPALLRLSHQSEQWGSLCPTPSALPISQVCRVNAQDPRPRSAFSGMLSERGLPFGSCEFLPGPGAPSLLPLGWWYPKAANPRCPWPTSCTAFRRGVTGLELGFSLALQCPSPDLPGAREEGSCHLTIAFSHEPL